MRTTIIIATFFAAFAAAAPADVDARQVLTALDYPLRTSNNPLPDQDCPGPTLPRQHRHRRASQHPRQRAENLHQSQLWQPGRQRQRQQGGCRGEFYFWDL
jgi:hypothetical protein